MATPLNNIFKQAADDARAELDNYKNVESVSPALQAAHQAHKTAWPDCDISLEEMKGCKSDGTAVYHETFYALARSDLEITNAAQVLEIEQLKRKQRSIELDHYWDKVRFEGQLTMLQARLKLLIGAAEYVVGMQSPMALADLRAAITTAKE